jgi:hypothetical protein
LHYVVSIFTLNELIASGDSSHIYIVSWNQHSGIMG